MHRNYIKMYFLSLTADIFHNQVAKYTAGVSQLEWREVETGQLPTPRFDLRAAMVDSIIHITGGKDDGDTDLTSILSWDPSMESWQPAGDSTVGRYWHAAIAVPSLIIESRCSSVKRCQGTNIISEFST